MPPLSLARSSLCLALLTHLLSSPALAGQSARDSSTPSSPVAATSRRGDQGVFVAYELSEMITNRFRNFAIEGGYQVSPRYRIRGSALEVDLTERDLAGWWSASVEGKGVKGYFRAYELNVDRFLTRTWYVSANLGYIGNTFQHVTLPDRIHNDTFVAGLGFGYSRPNLFGVRHLYFDFTNPVRYYFTPIPESRLGAATVRAHTIVPNTWFFVGYKR